MLPPLRLDLSFADVAAGLAACGAAWDAGAGSRRVEAAWPDEGALACLSVRSSFDLLLRALALPAGSEVLLSGFTIPHLPEIVRRHGLVPVPVDVDLETLALDVDDLARRVTERSRVVVVAQLFGGRNELGPLAASCKQHGLLLVEDAAQAFTGVSVEVGAACRADPAADVSLWSFGTIKTATALGGGVAVVRDAGLRERMRALRDGDPLQSRLAYLRRVIRANVLKKLGWPPVYGGLVRLLRLAGVDHAALLRRAVRGFPGDDVLTAIRQRPCAPLLALLARRLAQDHTKRVAARRACGEALLAALRGRVEVPGSAAAERSHWVFPVLVADPDETVRRLRTIGVDAVRTATVAAFGDPPPPGCARLEREIVYVPLPRGVDARGIAGIAAALDAPVGRSGA